MPRKEAIQQKSQVSNGKYWLIVPV